MHSVLAVNRCLEPGIGFYDLDGEMTGEKTFVIALPVRLQKEELSGFLLMGEKKSGTRYSMEDVDLLKSVLNQYAAAIERIRLQRDLLLKHEEMRRLDELNRMKSFFVSSVSHDLQTPLTSIKMFAEMLRSGKTLSVEEQNEYLAIIQGETERLSRLINNVLDFSRIERGIKSYNFSRMDLIQVVNEVLRVMHYTIVQNGFQVQAALPAEKIILKIDRDAIAEALMNLISNAIKYSETVKHMRIAVHKEDDYVVLSVQDSGVGIDESEKEKIFTTFYRSEDPKVKTRGGAGLGLTLVKHIAEAHNGKITVESKTGQGSTFSLYLPEGDQ
jgi:signal transduction histidine kinase